jgi:Family of unknown function (DUF6412)
MTAVLNVRAGALMVLAIAMQVAGYALFGSAGVTMLSAAVLAVVLAGIVAAALADGALARLVTAAPLLGRAAGLREKAWCAAFLRQRDPDAAGRARPRAPSAAPAAA